MSDDNISRIQRLEQTIQQLIMQKQQFQRDFLELESAITELKTASEAWKLVGGIMVRVDPKDHMSLLQERLKAVKMRISSVEKQEDSLREKVKSLQSSVLENMGDESKN